MNSSEAQTPSIIALGRGLRSSDSLASVWQRLVEPHLTLAFCVRLESCNGASHTQMCFVSSVDPNRYHFNQAASKHHETIRIAQVLSGSNVRTIREDRETLSNTGPYFVCRLNSCNHRSYSDVGKYFTGKLPGEHVRPVRFKLEQQQFHFLPLLDQRTFLLEKQAKKHHFFLTIINRLSFVVCSVLRLLDPQAALPPDCDRMHWREVV